MQQREALALNYVSRQQYLIWWFLYYLCSHLFSLQYSFHFLASVTENNILKCSQTRMRAQPQTNRCAINAWKNIYIYVEMQAHNNFTGLFSFLKILNVSNNDDLTTFQHLFNFHFSRKIFSGAKNLTSSWKHLFYETNSRVDAYLITTLLNSTKVIYPS